MAELKVIFILPAQTFHYSCEIKQVDEDTLGHNQQNMCMECSIYSLHQMFTGHYEHDQGLLAVFIG